MPISNSAAGLPAAAAARSAGPPIVVGSAFVGRVAGGGGGLGGGGGGGAGRWSGGRELGRSSPLSVSAPSGPASVWARPAARSRFVWRELLPLRVLRVLPVSLLQPAPPFCAAAAAASAPTSAPGVLRRDH